jgi:Tn3 transposase DDE domain
MAHGCNLGVYTMAQLTSNVSYEQLKRIGDWHLTEEAQRLGGIGERDHVENYMDPSHTITSESASGWNR